MNDAPALTDADDDPVVVVQTVSTPAGPTVMVSVTGEIDMLTETPLLDGLREALGQPGATVVVIDLSQVTFFSSSGIAALANAHATAAEQGLLLQVVVPPDSGTYRPLQLTGMTELLTIHPTLQAALADQTSVAGGGVNDPTTGDDDDPHDPAHHLAPA